MNSIAIGIKIMKDICNSCKSNKNVCSLCRLAQWDRAAYLYVTDGLSEQQAVEQTEKEIYAAIKDITDRYDYKHSIQS